jgi:hypothetical protein
MVARCHVIRANKKRNQTKRQVRLKLPFGYYLERYADLLILRRPDSSFVTAFSARDVDLFEVECTVWEDAD